MTHTKRLRDWLPELFSERDMRPTTKLVGAYKLSSPDQESITEIAQQLQLDRSTVRRALGELKEDGWVDRDHHGLWICPLSGTSI